MCEYQRIDPNNDKAAPMCEFTKNLCTVCVRGNAKTYKAAKLKDSKINILRQQIKTNF